MWLNPKVAHVNTVMNCNWLRLESLSSLNADKGFSSEYLHMIFFGIFSYVKTVAVSMYHSLQEPHMKQFLPASKTGFKNLLRKGSRTIWVLKFCNKAKHFQFSWQFFCSNSRIHYYPNILWNCFFSQNSTCWLYLNVSNSRERRYTKAKV